MSILDVFCEIDMPDEPISTDDQQSGYREKNPLSEHEEGM